MSNMLRYFKFFCLTIYVSFINLPLYLKKPHPLALKRYGIRIVAVTHDPLQEEDFCNAAYDALVLLDEHENNMLQRVKRYTKIICLSPTNKKAGTIPTFGLYFVTSIRFPANFTVTRLPITIAGFLVGQATLAKLNGCMANEDKINGAAKLEVCRKRYRLTLHKLDLNPTSQP